MRILGLAVGVWRSAAAQGASRLAVDTTACSRCAIVLGKPLQLGTTDGPGIIEHGESRATRDGRGRFLVVGSYASTIKIYDADGRFRGTIGRRGGGPGEFQGIGRVVLGRGDSVVVFDQMTSRATILSPGLLPVRSVRLPLAPELQSLWLRDGRFVVNVPVRTPERVGQPLHLIDGEGRFLRSFGSQSGVYRPDVPYLDRRAIARATDGLVWSAYRTQYVVDLLDPASGRLVFSLERRAGWFPSRLRPTSPRAKEVRAPEPFVLNVSQDDAGLLWLLIAVADRDWRRGVRAAAAGEPHLTITADWEYFDTMLEVIDPNNGRLLASRRLPEYVTHFVAPNLIGGVIDDGNGVPRLQVRSIALVFPKP